MDCNYISQFHALQVLLALKKGIALERWSKGLSVMLEKMFGVQLVSKLWAIFLMEADFNAMNKEMYGIWMLDNAGRYKLIPEEIFSKQNRTADNGGLAKTLFYDIARQMRTPAAMASVDASNCYDLIAHCWKLRCARPSPLVSIVGR
jgi:soluble lytic murein transglycosylase-like protein